MKILIWLYYYPPYISGVSIYAKNLAEWLVKQWHKVTVLCAQHDTSLPKQECVNGVNIMREKVLFSLGKGVVMPFFFLKLVNMSKDFDVVNIHFPNADLGISSMFIPSNKLFITYHCDINLWKGLVNTIVERLSFAFMTFAMKRAKNIIGNSSEYFEHSYFKRFIDKFREIHPPINFQEMMLAKKKFLFEKKQDVYYVWFLWRIVYEKGINFLLEALEDKRLKDKKICLLIWWDYENIRGWSVLSDLEELLEKNKYRVVLLGKIPWEELPSFYSTLDVLVLPSIDPLESFWMVQVEALFNNTPVIASNMPWVNQVVKKTKFWYLSEIKSPSSIATMILKMMDEKEKYHTLREKNVLKKNVEEKFSYDDSIEQYSIYFGIKK